MRHPRLVALWTSFVLAALSPASADATPFSATLGVTVGSFGTVQFAGASSGTSTANQVAVPAGLFAGTASVPVVGDPLITKVVVKVAGNGPAGFTGNPLNGTMPVFGGVTVLVARVPLFTTHTFFSGAGDAVGLGVGGTWGYATGSKPPHYLTVVNTDWTEGMKTVMGLPYTYIYHVGVGMAASGTVPYPYTNGTAMYTGSDSRTPGGLGQVTLVTPTKVTTDTPGVSMVILGTLTLNFVPEPGTLLLLGFGVTALAVLGRRRMGRST